MANDLAGLTTKLATALRDSTHVAWAEAEKNDLITQSVAMLWPRYARHMDPTASTITLVDGTYFYAAPTGMKEVNLLERVGPDDEEYGFVSDTAWHTLGDAYSTFLKVRVSPSIVSGGGTLRCHGFGPYDTTTNLIPDVLVPLVIAMSRGEAYRRLAGDRVRFEQWLAQNQKQNVTVNELLGYISEADQEQERLRARIPATQRRPVAGRLG